MLISLKYADSDKINEIIKNESVFSKWSRRADEVIEMNELIDACISHGGDSGGAYFSCEDWVVECLKIWLKRHKLTKWFKVLGVMIVPLDWKMNSDGYLITEGRKLSDYYLKVFPNLREIKMMAADGVPSQAIAAALGITVEQYSEYIQKYGDFERAISAGRKQHYEHMKKNGLIKRGGS